MISLPPLVSKGAPIRAADQNKLINAVRQLAAGSVARGGGAGMLRSRGAAGKKRPFEVSVFWDAARGGVIVHAEPGIWHGTGDPQSVPAGITVSEADTWILPGDKDETTGEYKPFEHLAGSTSASGRVVLKGTLVNGKIASVTIEWTTDPVEKNDLSSGTVEHTVAAVDFTVADGALKSSTVLQHLNGDFWMNSLGGGSSAEPWAGNPFAWTRVGERTWQLAKTCVMVTPHQLFGNGKINGGSFAFNRCFSPGSFSFTDESGVEGTETIAAPLTFRVDDGISVTVDSDENFLESGLCVLIYAELYARNGTAPTLAWCSRVVRGSEWAFPWVAQRLIGHYAFKASFTEFGAVQTLAVEQEAFFDMYRAGYYRLCIPMAIIAANHLGEPSLVPIRQGMIEVRPTIALGLKASHFTEDVYAEIDETDCAGSWEAGRVYSTEATPCLAPYAASTSVEALDFSDM